MKRFFQSTDGAVSVEFCLWLVVLVTVIMLAADATILLTRQSELIDVAREIARQLAIGALEVDQMQTVLDLRWPGDPTYVANVVEQDNFFVVSVTVPFNEVMVFGDSFVGDNTLEGRVVMARETGA